MTMTPTRAAPAVDSGWELLDKLARSEPDLAPLARLELRAIRAAADGVWQEGVPNQLQGASAEAPLLQGQTIGVHATRLRALLADLAADLAAPSEPATRLHAAIRGGDIDPIDVVYAAITYDRDRLARVAERVDANTEALSVVAHLAAVPLLLACQRNAANTPTVGGAARGYCPLCGAWPMLAEMRGLDRDHWLRCGRCASAWQFPLGRCVYCGEQDHEQLSYLAPEQERESRRAATCDQCRGYLKTFASLGPLSLAEILARDLSSVELDVAALDAEYSRPSETGYRLDLCLDPIRPKSWFGWRS